MIYTPREMILEKIPFYLKRNNYFLALINRNVKENNKFIMNKHKNGYFFMSKDFDEEKKFSISISNKGTIEMDSVTEEESKLKDGRIAPINCNTKVFVTKNKNNTFTISQRIILTAEFMTKEEIKNYESGASAIYIGNKYAKLQKQEKRVYNSNQTLKSINTNIYKMESKYLYEEKINWDEFAPTVENLYYLFLDKERALLKCSKIDPNTKEEKCEYFLTKFNIVEKEDKDQREKISYDVYNLIYQEKKAEQIKNNSSDKAKIMIKRK